MTTNSDLTAIWSRLERLGVRQGWSAAPEPPAPETTTTARSRRGPAIEELEPGRLVDNARGRFFLGERRYPLDHGHGRLPLGDALAHGARAAAEFAGPRLDLTRAAFIDTETTGLAGGTGTYTFLIGVGRVQDDHFCLEQYFMRDHGEEPAMLVALRERLAGLTGVVSFNGRAFDMPLLDTRLTCNRLSWPLADAPHLDLLLPARRLWRARLDSCALGSLESHVLGVRRTWEDVPGHVIPSLYFQYLQDGDARSMSCVFYHNVIDILSMVTLAGVMGDRLAGPDAPDLHAVDQYSLGRLYESWGRVDEAAAAYRRALADALPPDIQQAARRQFALLCKRQEWWEEALTIWQVVVVEDHTTIYAHVEIAKYYEHRVRDPDTAAHYTRQALDRVTATGFPATRAECRALRDELEHRLRRLERKQSSRSETDT